MARKGIKDNRMAKKVEEKIGKAKAVKEGLKKSVGFWTASSKKVTLAMVFLISVIVDQTILGNVLYPSNELYESNLFKGIIATVGVILTSDIKGLVNKWLEK